MSKKNSILPEILDRSQEMGTWDQVIAEARLSIRELQKSIRFFECQKAKGEPYPGSKGLIDGAGGGSRSDSRCWDDVSYTKRDLHPEQHFPL